MAQATLYNPETGDRKAVEVGGQEAQQLFADDYYLETSYDPATGVSTYDGPGEDLKNDVPPEGDEITVGEKPPRIEKEGIQDTFFEDAQKAYQSGQEELDRMRLETMQELERRRSDELSASKDKLTEIEDKYEEWIKYDIDADVEEFREKTQYDEKLKKLTEIENQSADAWKTYQDMKNGVARNPNILSSQAAGMQGQYKEDYLAEATYLQMRADSVNGSLDRITSRLDNYRMQVQNMRQGMMQNYNTLLQLEKQNIISLRKEEKEYIDGTFKVLEDKFAREEKEKNAKRDLIGLALQQGIDTTEIDIRPDDTFEEMVGKLAPAIQERQDRQFNMRYSRSSDTSTEIAYPEDYTSPIQKFAYETAVSLAAGEPKDGYSDTAWEGKLQDFMDKSGEVGPAVTTKEEANRLLKDAMWRYKGTDLPSKDDETSFNNIKTMLSTPSGVKEIQRSNQFKEYKERAGELISEYWTANDKRKEEIKKELRSIPREFEGQTVYQTLGAF